MAKPKKSTKPTLPKIDDRAIVDDADFAKGDMDDDADEPDDEGDDDGDDGDDDDEDEQKSEVDVGDLRKAMDALENAGNAAASGVSPRASALAAKLAKGEKLSKAEVDELRDLTTEAAPTTTKDSIMQDPTIKEGVDASDFLDALLTKSSEAIDRIGAQLTKGLAGIDTFNATLAKSFVALGREVANLRDENNLLKGEIAGMKDALGIVAEQPRTPKGSTRPAKRPGMNKGGDDNHEEQGLPQSKISDTLDEMMLKSEFPQGVDGVVEISKYESTGIVRADVMEIVFKKNGLKMPNAAA